LTNLSKYKPSEKNRKENTIILTTKNLKMFIIYIGTLSWTQLTYIKKYFKLDSLRQNVPIQKIHNLQLINNSPRYPNPNGVFFFQKNPNLIQIKIKKLRLTHNINTF